MLMAQRETILQNHIRLAISNEFGRSVVLFRNHSGSLPDPHRPRVWITYGLGTGSPDLVGWRTTPTGVAQFVGIEIKTGTGRVDPEQINWLAQLAAAGGLAGVVRSVEEALALLRSPYPQQTNDCHPASCPQPSPAEGPQSPVDAGGHDTRPRPATN